MRHVFRSFIKALGLVVLAVVLVEAVLTLWNKGAFTEPNFYQTDPDFGLRLIPDSSMQLAFLGVHPAHEVNINRDGYRGTDFPEPADTDIIVLGDSLGFGLGVADDQTFSVQLEGILGDGSQVHNYSVPSYALHEQTRLLSEILSDRPVRRLIYAISTGRVLGEVPEPFGGRLYANHGWVTPGKEGNVQIDLPLPGPVIRWSHTVNLIRQQKRAPSLEEGARRVVNDRWDELEQGAVKAAEQRARVTGAKWHELQGPGGEPRTWSHLLPHLRALKSVVRDSGTEVIILILPQDVMIDPAAWGKYGLEPRDSSPAQILVEDLGATARALGFSVVDPLPELKRVGTSATLTRDWHFSPTGHQAIAGALKTRLSPGAR